MFEISDDFSWRVREKRAKKRLNLKLAAIDIGISRQTLSQIESGKKKYIKKNVYEKLTNWWISAYR